MSSRDLSPTLQLLFRVSTLLHSPQVYRCVVSRPIHSAAEFAMICLDKCVYVLYHMRFLGCHIDVSNDFGGYRMRTEGAPKTPLKGPERSESLASS